MHPKHLIITAIGLLILCSVLIIRKSGNNNLHAGISGSSTNTSPAKGRVANRLGGSPLSGAETPAIRSATEVPKGATVDLAKSPVASVPRGNTTKNPPGTGPDISNNHVVGNPNDSAVDDSVQQSAASPESAPVSPAKGIQLAENVKLPAVILAINAAENDPQNKLPEPVKAAMHGIVDTFYRDLADSASNDTEVASAETGTGDTIVIHPGPAVEQARERANETYRALFGDAAFNQMTMNAMLESQLPVDSASAGK